MVDHDAGPFVALLREVFGLYPSARPLTDGQVAMFFRALRAYPLDAVRAGLDAHVRDPQRGRFPPVPADVIAQVEARSEDDGRPEAAEAWAIALRGDDEDATVVWTDEAAAAWGIALPVLRSGDDVGARVAFKAAYERLVREARAACRPARWTSSLGRDPAQRSVALTDAVKAGRLPHSALPAPVAPGGLLELAASQSVPPEVRQRLLRIRDDLTREPSDTEALPPDALRTAAAKQRAAALVAGYEARSEGEPA